MHKRSGTQDPRNAPICQTLEHTTIRDSKGVNPTYFEWKPSCPPAPRALLGDCVVCLDTQAKSVLLPCAHRCVCEKHAKACKKCPICRRDVTGFLPQVFDSCVVVV